jgi:hypothetical protein
VRLAPARSAWRVPPSWHRETAAPSAVVPSEEHRSRVQLALKVAFVVALASLTGLDRFGLRLSASYAIHPTLIATYGLVAVMLLTGSARIDRGAALLYVIVVTVAAVSFVVNLSLPLRQYASIGSLMLVVVLYAPLALSLRPEVGTAELWQWLIRAYIGFAVACGAIGIIQFYAQFVFTAPWLFDYRPMIPEAIRGSGVYNTTNYAGSDQIVKTNGFFLREASGLSILLALALVSEWTFARRKWVISVLVFALVVSYSGSGLLAIGVAMLFPLGRRTLLRIVAVALAGAIVFVLFGDALNLGYTLSRVGEFQVNDPAKSSAYCRFIAPGEVAMDQIDSAPWTAYLGHGPGTMQKMNDVCETTYAKLIFEYGLLGTVAFASLMVVSLNRSMAPVRMRVAQGVTWLLLGGNLVAPDPLLVTFLLSAMWPKGLLSPVNVAAGANRND